MRWVWVTLAVVLVGIVAFVAWPQPERIALKNYGRITRGMSQTEVCALLGPPGDYTTGPVTLVGLQGFPDEHEPYLSWDFDDGAVYVTFRGDPRIAVKAWFAPGDRGEQSPLGDFLWRAKRLWHRWFPEKPEAP